RTHSGDAFIRSGESKKKLSIEEAREIEIDKGQLDIEQEPCRLSFPQDFDVELVRQFVNNFKSKRGLSDEHPNEKILELNHLGKIDTNKGFIPNNACALLFAKDPREIYPGCKIRFLLFDGEVEGTGDKWNAVKDEWIDIGSLPRQIVAIERVMDAQIRIFNYLSKEGLY